MPSLSNNDAPTTDDLRNDAASWLRLQELYHLLEATPAGAQAAALESATDDPGLRARVLSLLATSSEPETPAPAAFLPIGAGSRVGPYAILRHLGSGGLGSVYLIERLIGGAIQPCALKLLAMRSTDASFHARFEREQQILATLQHPNITHLLDAGISDMGQPYLVMEFVDGVDLTQYCDGHRLSVEERLRTLLQICEAVAYAHRSLTVHLDLKPSNVLVSGEGQVKLLDFGTSKLIDADGSLTTTVLATPAYAAPEQFRNEPVTTACDVYSLGVILFELLSGRRPFENASVAMVMERAFQEQEPALVTSAITPVSAEARGLTVVRLRQVLHGDLSTIVARCLHSRPRDRYPSVDALSEDLRRYLGGLPVLARRQTVRYRMTKFVRRHVPAVLTTAAATLAVASSLTLAVVRQHEALRDADRAVQMQQFMTRLFRLAHTGATGKPAATVGELLQVGEQTLPSFISNPVDLRAAKLSIAESMYDDEDTAHALPLLKQLGSEARQAEDRPVEAKADILASDLLYLTGDPKQAAPLAERAFTLSRDRHLSAELRTQVVALYVQNKDGAGDRGPQSMDLLRTLIAESERAHAPEDQTASAMNILGLGLGARGQYDEAKRYFARSLAIYQRTPYATCDAAATVRYGASIDEKLGYNPAALAGFRQSYEMQRKCAGDEDLGTLSAQAWFASELTLAGQSQAALAMMEPALPMWRSVVGADSMHLMRPLLVLARAYLGVGRYTEAETVSREALRVLHGQVAKKSINMATAEETLAESLAAQQRFRDALPLANAAVDDFPVTPAMAPGLQRRYVQAQKVRGDVQAHLPQAPAR